MILPTIFCCQVLASLFGVNLAEIAESELMLAICGDLNDEGRARLRSLGGYAPTAFPTYMKWLDEDLRHSRHTIERTLFILQLAEGDKSAFRPHATRLASHDNKFVSRNAIHLLAQIGTEEDAATVVGQLKRRTNDIAYFDSIISTLAVIGTEKEVGVIEAERKAGFLNDYPRFWARVDDCEKVIRERAAKKKDTKATPPKKDDKK